MTGSEMILYAYGAVCVCMLLFNIAYNLFQEGRDRRLKRHTKKLEEVISHQLKRLESGEAIDPKHLQYMEQRLSKVNELIAFDRAIDQILTGENAIVEEYRHQMQPLIVRLAEVYQNHENMQAAYFAYFLSRHNLRRDMDMSQAEAIMLSYMEKDSLYCRLNALQALYEFGTPESVAKAVMYQDRSDSFFHEKLLTDGLLTFKGDHQRLIALLWDLFQQMSNKCKLSILNYIRFKSGDYTEQMRSIMEDPKEDKELRLSAVRYFGRYFCPSVKDGLLSFASDRDPLNWEYTAVAVSCLADYPGDDVTETLMAAVHSSNWYIRYNAAVSLESRELEYSDLIDILGGQDRYAREIMMCRLSERRMKDEIYQEREMAMV